MTYPALTAAADHVVTTLGSELPDVMTESQVFALAVAQLFEVDANGEPTAIPLGQSGPFVVEIDSEEILCSSFANGQTGVYFDGTTDGRGYNDTTIAAHNPNATARVISTSVQSVATGGGTSVTSPSGTINVTDGDEIDVHGMEYAEPDVGIFNDAQTIGFNTDTEGGGFVIQTAGGPIEVYANDGSPVGVVTPSSIGSLCVDISTGDYWVATGTTDTDWTQLGSGGGSGYDSLTGAGESATPGALVQLGGFTVYDSEADGIILKTDGGDIEFISLAANLRLQINNNGTFIFDQNGEGGTGNGMFLHVSNGSPVGAVTPILGVNDVCYDYANGNWYTATGGGDTDWVLTSGANLPTADPHVAGSVWNNLGIMTVSAG